MLLNLYLVDIGFHEDFLGFVSLVQSLAATIAALAAGWITPAFGPRRVLIGATVLTAIGFLAISIVREPPLILVVSAVMGIGMAHLWVAGAPFVADNAEPAQRSSAFSAAFFTMGAASALGSALGGTLPGIFGGDQSVAYASALRVAAACVLAGVVPLLLADDRKVESSIRVDVSGTSAASSRSMNRDLAAVFIANGLFAGGAGVIIQFFNVYLQEVVRAPSESIGIVFALSSAFLAPASLLAPLAGRRFGLVPVIVFARLAVVPFLLALVFFSPNVAIGGAAFCVRALFTGLGQPLNDAFVMGLVPPRRRAQVSAQQNISWNVSWAICTGLAGVVIVEITRVASLEVGYAAIFGFSMILAIASAAVYYFAFRSSPAPGDQPTV